MTEDELKAIEERANAPDEAWRGGSIPSARHEILMLVAEVRRLRAIEARAGDLEEPYRAYVLEEDE